MPENLIGEEESRTTAVRVLSVENGQPIMEISFEAKGRLLGEEIADVGTYVATPRPDGTLAGEGQGVLMTPKGDVVLWKGSGIGTPSGTGMGVTWRANLQYETRSPRFERLAKAPVRAEYAVRDDGSGSSKLYEWT